MSIDPSAIRADDFDGFCLDDECEPMVLDQMIPEWAQPMLTVPEAWDNYTDDLVYEADKRLRSWIEKMRPTWTRRGLDRRYSFSELIEILGLSSQVSKLSRGGNRNKVARVFAYYSTKIQPVARVSGKKKKSVYTISPARLKKPPYSLRLRMETMETEHPKRLMMPKDDLEPGHARNPRTEENMRRRSEEQRRRFNEYQARRRESVGRKD